MLIIRWLFDDDDLPWGLQCSLHLALWRWRWLHLHLAARPLSLLKLRCLILWAIMALLSPNEVTRLSKVTRLAKAFSGLLFCTSFFCTFVSSSRCFPILCRFVHVKSRCIYPRSKHVSENDPLLLDRDLKPVSNPVPQHQNVKNKRRLIHYTTVLRSHWYLFRFGWMSLHF